MGLDDELSRNGRSIRTVAAWLQAHADEHWSSSWREHLPELRRAWDRVGEPAYGVYGRRLFQSIDDDLKRAGLTCTPRLPGAFELSEEHWGPLRDRERRL